MVEHGFDDIHFEFSLDLNHHKISIDKVFEYQSFSSSDERDGIQVNKKKTEMWSYVRSTRRNHANMKEVKEKLTEGNAWHSRSECKRNQERIQQIGRLKNMKRTT